jgi:hypothetical protein
MFCQHCGARQDVIPDAGIPCSAKALTAFRLLCEDFEERHAKCKETDDSPSKKAGRSPEDWLQSGDTGISSETIWSVMTGHPAGRYGVPRDPADFGRCHRLLALFPTWRERLPEVTVRFPEWALLIEAWPELTRLYVEEIVSDTAPKLYARICALRGLK